MAWDGAAIAKKRRRRPKPSTLGAHSSSTCGFNPKSTTTLLNASLRFARSQSTSWFPSLQGARRHEYEYGEHRGGRGGDGHQPDRQPGRGRVQHAAPDRGGLHHHRRLHLRHGPVVRLRLDQVEGRDEGGRFVRVDLRHSARAPQGMRARRHHLHVADSPCKFNFSFFFWTSFLFSLSPSPLPSHAD